MPNRLADCTSPYLLQHRDNPVDWWEWSPEAFAEAERRGVPVLLSIGYAACHWCHVMAHESFEDDETAAYMNEHFVNVKVDREERPDVDAVYMEAVQAMTGHGGWPMTSFLTAQGEPFFCGTYWPREPRAAACRASGRCSSPSRRPGTTRRDEVAGRGRARSSQRLARTGPGGAPRRSPRSCSTRRRRRRCARRTTACTAASAARRSSRRRWCSSSCCGTPPAPATGLRAGRAHLPRRWPRGGMYDQLAGGFARYSVDAQWVVPHFEKMLYDNALLLRVYAAPVAGDRRRRSPRRVALETADFLLRDLRTAEGGFASALDADTDGEEGLTYVWTPAQLVDALGDDDGRWAAEQFDVTAAGTFEHGTLGAAAAGRARRPRPLRPGLRPPARGAGRRARSRAATTRSSPPGTAWPIAALAEAGVLLDRPDLGGGGRRAAPTCCAAAALDVDGRLLRTSRRRRGRAGTPGCSRTTPTSPRGCSRCTQATGDAARLRRRAGAARRRAGALRRRRAAASSTPPTTPSSWCGGRRTRPTARRRPGLSAAAGALLTYARAHRVEARYRAAAEAALRDGRAAARPARPLRRLGGWRSARRCSPDRPRSSCWTGPTCCASPGSATSPGRRRRRPPGRWPRAASRARPTSAGDSCARRRRPTRSGWPSSWAGRADGVAALEVSAVRREATPRRSGWRTPRA